jgi:hypothetical protein
VKNRHRASRRVRHSLKSHGFEPLELRRLLAVNVLTWHGDLTRQGLNGNEVALTPANVNRNAFGELFSYPVSGQVYAQPLYVSNLTIPGKGTHNVVFVVTMTNDVYALNADSNSGVGAGVLWHVNLGTPAAVPNPYFGNRYGPDHDTTPYVGITSTPVIDLSTGTMYLDSFTNDVPGQNSYSHHIHALDITTGADKVTPMLVAASVPGNGVGGDGTTVTFNAEQQIQRAAVTLSGGVLYVSYAAYADTDPYHGWILGFDPSTLQLMSVFNTTPNNDTDAHEGEGGIWQSGNGFSSDGTRLYFATGNGDFNASIGDYGDSVLAVVPDSSTPGSPNINGYGLAIADYFTPYNEQALSDADSDLGSGGTLVLPDQSGAHPHELIQAGKQGRIYVIDRDNMGGHNPASAMTDNVVQTVSLGHGVWGSPAYFNSSIYYHAVGDVMKRYTITNGLLSAAPAAQGTIVYNTWNSTPSISANGTANGIVWDVQWDASHQVLHAYDATTLAELYNSNQNLARDQMGGGVKFITPTIADGKVFVGSSGALSVYGLLVPVTTPPPAPSDLSATPISSSQINLAWVDNADNEAGFKIERSTDNTSFTQIAMVGTSVTSYSDTSVIANTQYYYRIRATNAIGDSAYSNSANATTPVVAGPVGSYHFDEGSGTATLDAAGTNNGTLVGDTPPQWVTSGKAGAALSFSGDGVANSAANQSAVQTSSNLATVLGSTSTLDVWIKTTQVGSNVHYAAPAITGVEQAGGANDINWGVLDATGRIGIYVGDSAGAFSTYPVNDGAWHNVAMTRDAGTGVIRLYVDGVLNATAIGATGAKSTAFNRIGALTDVANDGVTITGANYFNGQLDELRIYNQALGPNDIAGLALAPNAPNLQSATLNPGPVVHLAFTNSSSYAINLEIDRKAGVNGSYVPLATLSASATMYDDTTVAIGNSYYYIVRAIDAAGTSAPSAALSVTVPLPTIVGRSIFYNGSAFDGQNGTSNLTDINAIATDKQPLLRGGTATFQNYTSYSKGVTGIIIDIANEDALARPDDFDFRVGNDNNPAGWALAPTQYLINTYPGRGPGGSTQITIIWYDNDIQNEWLQVTVLGQGHLGIGTDDVFYFGNAIGDTGDSGADALVTASDVSRVNSHGSASAEVTNIYDINRDGVVDAADATIVSDNLSTPATTLNLISFAGTVPTVATPASATPSPVTGTSTNLSVLGADSGGEAGLTYTWSLSGSPPAPVSYSDNGTNTAKNTTATFTTAGTYNFQVTITNPSGLSSTSSVSVQVNQVTTSIAVTPGSLKLPANTTASLSASALDQFGNPMASQPALTWSIASGAGSVSAAGVYTAPRTPGACTVRATIPGGMFGSTNLTTFYDAVDWYQSDASAATLADSSGNSFTATMTGTLNTNYNFAAGVEGTGLHLITAATPAAEYATLPTGIVSSLNDFTIATWVKVDTLATWSRIFDFGNSTNVYMFLTPRANGTGGPLRFAITTSGNAAGAEQQLDGPVLAAGTWYHIAVTLVGNTGTLYVNGAAVATNANMTIHPTNMGVTTRNYLGKSQYGDPGFQGSIDDFRIYSRGLSAQEVLQLAKPAVVTAAAIAPLTNTTAVLSVLGSDVTAGESALTYTWVTTGTPPAPVTFSANGTNAAKNTTATFTKVGTYNFQVTIANPAAGLSTTSAVSITIAQVASGVAITPSTVTVVAGATTQLVAAAVDQFSNAMPTQPTFTWSVISGSGSVNSAGLYTAGAAAGSANVRATASTGPIGNAAVTVVAPLVWYKANESSGTMLGDSSGSGKNGTASGSASFAAGVSGNSLHLTGGAATLPNSIVSALNDFTIAAWVKVDTLANWARLFDFGSGTTSYMFLTSRAGATGNPLRFAITTAGNGSEQQLNGPILAAATWYHIAVTLSGNTGTLYVNGAVAATNTSMTIHPANLGNTTQDFLGDSQFTADPNLLGSIDDFRLYGVGLSAGQVAQLASPIVVNPSATSANPVTTTTTALSVLGADLTAGESALTYAWATIGTPPAPVAFSANGTNAAKNTVATFTQPGTYNFQVTIVNPSAGLSTTSSVSVVVNQTLTSIVVTPASASLIDSQTQQFSATAKDQFGGALSSQPMFTWSTSGGSITASGAYTAPFAAGSFQVTAASGAISGLANVTVSLLKGDMDGDGQRTIADVSILGGALADLNAYQSGHSFTGGDLSAVANIDSDNSVTNLDLQALIVLLANGAGGGGGIAALSAAAGEASSDAQNSARSSTTMDLPTVSAQISAVTALPELLIEPGSLILPRRARSLSTMNSYSVVESDLPGRRSSGLLIQTPASAHTAIDSFFSQLGLRTPISRRSHRWFASRSDDATVFDDVDRISGAL